MAGKKFYSLFFFANLLDKDQIFVLRGSQWRVLNIDEKAFKVNVYADDNNVREIEVAPIEVGYGRNIMLTNIGINLLSVDKFKLMIESNFSEINSDNNEIVLNLKN